MRLNELWSSMTKWSEPLAQQALNARPVELQAELRPEHRTFQRQKLMERYPFLPLQAHVVTHTFCSILLALHMPYALRGYACRQGQAQSLSRSRGVQQALVLVLLAQDASTRGLLI